MPRRRTVIEYRDYALPTQFPVMVLTGERWRISDKPSGLFHFRNCMEIGICESDAATVEFPDMTFRVKAGDVTVPGGVAPVSGKLPGAMPIASALTYIEDNYAQQFPMPMLADLCHMSHSHFRRIFQQIMGCGPLEYLNRMRIEHACTLLRTTRDSILDISEQSGFLSLSSFNRHFLATVGTTPTEWRRRMNADQAFTIQNYRGWLAPPDETDPFNRGGEA